MLGEWTVFIWNRCSQIFILICAWVGTRYRLYVIANWEVVVAVIRPAHEHKNGLQYFKASKFKHTKRVLWGVGSLLSD